MADAETPKQRNVGTTVLGNPWVRFVGLLLIIYVALRVLYVIRGVLIPFSLAALMMAYIFDPVVDWLETRRVGGRRLTRGVAVGLLVGGFLAVLALFVYVAVPSFVATASDLLSKKNVEDMIQLLPENVRQLVEKLQQATPEERGKLIKGLLGDLFSRQRAVDAVGESARAVVFTTFAAIMWVFQFILFFVVTVFLLVDIDRLRQWVRGLVPRRYRGEVERIGGAVDVNLKGFFRGQCMVVGMLACIYTAGLAAVGCPFWYLVGVAAGVGAFVPYFDLAVGMVPGIILSVALYQDVGHPVAVACVFAVGKAVDNLVITPRILSRSVGMHPVAIILSILIFGTLFGFLGVIFAVPIAAVVKVFFQELYARYRSSPLYTGPAGNAG